MPNQHPPEETKGRKPWITVVLVLVVLIILIFISAVIAAFMFGTATDQGLHAPRARSVAALAKKAGNEIFVTWEGGADNAEVVSYGVSVGTSTGAVYSVDNLPPIVGDVHDVGMGTSGKDRVAVVAKFTDGSYQVVLDYYV